MTKTIYDSFGNTRGEVQTIDEAPIEPTHLCVYCQSYHPKDYTCKGRLMANGDSAKAQEYWPEGPLTGRELNQWWRDEWGPLQEGLGTLYVDSLKAPQEAIEHLKSEVSTPVKVEVIHTELAGSSMNDTITSRAEQAENVESDTEDTGQENNLPSREEDVERFDSLSDRMRWVQKIKDDPDPKGEITGIKQIGTDDAIEQIGNENRIQVTYEIYGDTITETYDIPEPSGMTYEFEKVVGYCKSSLYSIEAIVGSQVPMEYDGNGWSTDFPFEGEDDTFEDTTEVNGSPYSQFKRSYNWITNVFQWVKENPVTKMLFAPLYIIPLYRWINNSSDKSDHTAEEIGSTILTLLTISVWFIAAFFLLDVPLGVV